MGFLPGFRFQKRIKILPGVTINLSKSGVSTSLGGHGATVNVGTSGKRTFSLGIPGTGLSYRVPLGGTVAAKDFLSVPQRVEHGRRIPVRVCVASGRSSF
jgi:hypothetical protein